MAGSRSEALIRGVSVRTLVCCGALLGCGSLVCCGPRGNVEHPRPLGGLMIVSEPDDALLYVDDKYMGTVASLASKPLPLAVGRHRLELRREGFFAHFAEVTIAEGVRQRLEVKLRQEPF